MSYSFALLAHVSWTRTFWPAQLAGVPATVRVKISQLTPFTHAASVLTPPPGAVAVPSQVAEGPPGAGPTVPLEGFCAYAPRSGIAHKRAMLSIKKSGLLMRDVTGTESFFIRA